jgi:hypothetical protein
MTMAGPPAPLHRLLRHAARRDLMALSLRRMGYWLAVACAFALAVLAVDRWLGLNVSRWVYAGIALAGAAGGIVHAVLARRDPLDIAVTLDHSLKLKDRVGSALALEQEGSRPFFDDGFAELVRQDAASLAGRVDVRAATPIYMTRVWVVALSLALAMWAGVAFLPNFAQRRADRLTQD